MSPHARREGRTSRGHHAVRGREGRDGLTATPARLADASLSARLRFEGVQVDADAVIGEVDGGRASLHARRGRAGAAAELLGVGAGAMERPSAISRTASSSVAIGSFQALQHRAAHLYSELEVARAAVLKAQQLLDAGDPGAERAVMVAKAMAGLAARSRFRRACRCTAASA